MRNCVISVKQCCFQHETSAGCSPRAKGLPEPSQGRTEFGLNREPRSLGFPSTEPGQTFLEQRNSRPVNGWLSPYLLYPEVGQEARGQKLKTRVPCGEEEEEAFWANNFGLLFGRIWFVSPLPLWKWGCFELGFTGQMMVFPSSCWTSFVIHRPYLFFWNLAFGHLAFKFWNILEEENPVRYA